LERRLRSSQRKKQSLNVFCFEGSKSSRAFGGRWRRELEMGVGGVVTEKYHPPGVTKGSRSRGRDSEEAKEKEEEGRKEEEEKVEGAEEERSKSKRQRRSA